MLFPVFFQVITPHLVNYTVRVRDKEVHEAALGWDLGSYWLGSVWFLEEVLFEPRAAG